MASRLNISFFFVLICFTSIYFLLADNQRMGWPVDFKYDSKSLPSIEVKLSPPENPLPQVSAEIKLLESSRLKLEEGLMQKLEDEYNKMLTTSKVKIQEIVEKSLSIFNNPNILGSIISQSLKTMKPNHLKKMGEFGDLNIQKLSVSDKTKNGALPPPEIRNHTSFIEQNKYLYKTIPSVKISLTEISEPDVSIKDKIEEIEQYRTDEEVMMFETAMSEFHSLREITVLELEKQIQLQLNPFLVDKNIVHKTLENELKKLEKTEEENKTKETLKNQTSFIQKENEKPNEKEDENESENTGNILNIKISQSDSDYPTIDQLVMEMQKRRDVTEMLERQKILELQTKLLKAQSEMIKDALHFSISKIIAQYSPIVETIKLEKMKMI